PFLPEWPPGSCPPSRQKAAGKRASQVVARDGLLRRANPASWGDQTLQMLMSHPPRILRRIKLPIRHKRLSAIGFGRNLQDAHPGLGLAILTLVAHLDSAPWGRNVQ